MNQLLVSRFISRLLHLIVAAYIIGHLLTFLYTSTDYLLIHESKESPTHTLYLLSGIVSVATGLFAIGLILYQYEPFLKNTLHVRWEYVLFIKLILCLFLTRFTDWIVSFFYARPTDQYLGGKIVNMVEVRNFFFYAGWIKLIALFLVLILSTYAKFYREELTNNFTKKSEGLFVTEDNDN